MVNLDKWEKVEHKDVRVGDLLKIVWSEKTSPTMTTREVYKSKVVSVGNAGFYLSDGSGWEEGDPAKNQTVSIYRRKDKPFELPTEFGAIISAVHYSSDKREWLVFDGEDWCAGLAAYSPDSIRENWVGLRLEREGIQLPSE
jgi:hypothetical protein